MYAARANITNGLIGSICTVPVRKANFTAKILNITKRVSVTKSERSAESEEDMTGNNDHHSVSPPLVSKGGKNPPPIVLYLLSVGVTASDSFSTTLLLCFSFRGSWGV